MRFFLCLNSDFIYDYLLRKKSTHFFIKKLNERVSFYLLILFKMREFLNKLFYTLFLYIYT
jgi:hypothetical protein